MDAKQFIAEFGHIANAPGGVQRLREMIYNLAVSGDLVQKIDGEGDGSDLLEEIVVEKNKRIKDKKFKRSPKFEKLNGKFPAKVKLPVHWVWTNLVSIGEISPKNEAEDNLDASFISMSAVSELHSGVLMPETRKWGNIKKGYTQFADGDVVIAKITPCFENGKSAVIEALENGIGAGTTELHVVRPLPGVNPRYIYVFLRSPYFRVEGELNMTGTAGQKRLTSEYFATRPFPLPPLREQTRIVAKVDELMALCDQLEDQQQQKRKLQNQLRQATLQAVASASSPFELKQHWQRLQDNFEQLFAAPEDVKEFKGLILDLAVNGNLTQELDEDDSSIDLLKKIYQAKKDGISKGTIKKKKPVVGEILERQFVPSYWEQLRLDDAITNMDAGWSPKCLVNPRQDENVWGVLKTTSVQVLKFLPGEHKELPASLDARPHYEIKLGDILVTRAGPNNRVGICCVVDSAPPKLMISDKLIRFHIVDDLIDARFVALCLSAGESGRIFESMKTGMAESQMNITQDRLRSVPIPLPPQAEQKRILKRVEELTELCGQYENKLTMSKRVAESLAAACITELTGINTPEEEEPLKTPQTELVAPVILGPNKPGSKDAAPLATLLTRQNGQMNANDLWQRFGGEVDAFYAQLKTEVAHGWLAEPVEAKMLEKDAS